MKYKLTRQIFDENGLAAVFTDIVEARSQDAAVRPFRLGRDASCDIADYADGRRVYEIRMCGVRQVIAAQCCGETASLEKGSGSMNCQPEGCISSCSGANLCVGNNPIQ